MPSPIAHIAVGYAIYEIYKPILPEQVSKRVGLVSQLLVVTVILSLLPDLDAVPGLVLGDFNRFHNNLTHSLGCGLVVAIGVGGVAHFLNAGFLRWFVLTLVCYDLHVFMDFFTYGRGVMLLWPISPERYQAPIEIFHGLRRDYGLVTIHHVWTFVNEASFATIVILTTYTFMNSGFRRLQSGGE